MKAKKKDLNKCGIYCIKNTINNKVYIGKSINIYKRIICHISFLNNKSKDENRHLIHSWHKYGKKAFTYFVIEYIDVNDLKDRELFWILEYKALDRSFGYNLRLDSETKCIVSDETRKKLSEARQRRIKSHPEDAIKTSEFFKKFWSNKKNVAKMVKSLKLAKMKYYFLQYDRNMNLIKQWESVEDIVNNNPTYKWQNIYSVCNGYKKTYMDSIWKKILRDSPTPLETVD